MLGSREFRNGSFFFSVSNCLLGVSTFSLSFSMFYVNLYVQFGIFQVVSALAIDHSGSRVLTGSYDYTVRMYDFQGMNSKLQSFRQLEPFEGHQVRSLSWSPTADRFLCVTGSAQAKVSSFISFQFIL